MEPSNFCHGGIPNISEMKRGNNGDISDKTGRVFPKRGYPRRTSSRGWLSTATPYLMFFLDSPV
jgi:hypothetical protein